MKLMNRLILNVPLLIVGLNALAGGFYGMSGAPHIPLEWLAKTPFQSYFFPSLILALIVGGSSLLSAFFVITKNAHAKSASLIAGGILFVWIVVQVAMIGYVSWLQPAMAATAVMIVVLAQRIER
jgi:hypothetical protein